MDTPDQELISGKAQIYSSFSSTAGYGIVGWSQQEEKALVRKFDWRILPGLSVLYLLNFLDRANIGNARLQGLEADLRMTGNDYNIALCLFFITYILFEVPSNIALRKLRPAFYFPALMFGWGIIMVLSSFVRSFAGLIVARVFLGMMESGYFPGVAFYLTNFYKRDELAFRIAIFFSMATLAGAFGGILAYGIGFIKGVGMFKNSWHWIFIIDGALTVIVSLIAPLFILDYPEVTRCLSRREGEISIVRLAKDSADKEIGFETKYVWKALKDPKLYVMVFIYLGSNSSQYAMSFFLPSIIKGLGYTDAQAQLMTAPPYILAFMMVYLSAYVSDRFKCRGYVNAFNFFMSIVGFIVLETTSTAVARYIGTFIVASGAFSGIAISIAWNSNNIRGSPTKRAVGIALQSSAGSVGGIIGSFVYVAADRPNYRKGHAVMIALNGLSFLLTWVMIFWLKSENKKIERAAMRKGVEPFRYII